MRYAVTESKFMMLIFRKTDKTGGTRYGIIQEKTGDRGRRHGKRTK